MMLPTTRHIKELIEHSENHLSIGENSDLKFALIHADNSIEIMMKEHLRYVKNKAWGEIDKKGFHSLLGACDEIDLLRDSKAYFQAYHDIRNSVYHTGTLVPPKEDVNSAIGLAKTLFNELHPEVKFTEAGVSIPSQEILGLLVDHKKPQSYLNEISLVYEFSKYLESIGYAVTLEQVIVDRIRADLVAVKNEEIVICEFKLHRKRLIGTPAFHQLYSMYSLLTSSKPEKKIQGWIITNGDFTEAVKDLSKQHNIRLIDGDELSKLVEKDKD